MSSRYLLLGCGRSRARRLDPLGCAGVLLEPRQDFSDGELLAVDLNRGCGPDLVMNLDAEEWFAYRADIGDKARPLMAPAEAYLTPNGSNVPRWRLASDTFDEVHAYEVLEHLGHLGEVEEFFSSFRNIWRVLKPNGYLCASVPSIHSAWAFGDPGHRRVITGGALDFLARTHPIDPPSSDYREWLDFDFDTVWRYDDGANLYFVLRALKPPRRFPGEA